MVPPSSDRIMDEVNNDAVWGGTFSGDPVSVNQGIKVLEQLDDDLYDHINGEAERIRKSVKVPIVGVGSISRILFTEKSIRNRKERDECENQEWKSEFYSKCFERGVYLGKNGIQFLSLAHTTEVVDEIIKIINSI